MSAEYKENVSLKDRQEDVKKALIKKPDYIPVFIEKSTTSNMPHLRSKTNDKIKSRYLLNGNLTIREFIECLHHNKTDEHDINDPIYLFHNNVLLSRSKTMKELYDEYKDFDGMLYLVYSNSYTWGKTLSTVSSKLYKILGY